MSFLCQKPFNGSMFMRIVMWIDDIQHFFHRVGGEDVWDWEKRGPEDFKEASSFHGV